MGDRKPSEKTIAISEELASAVEYLERQTEKVKFGRVEIAVTIHGGKIRFVERNTSENFKVN